MNVVASTEEPVKKKRPIYTNKKRQPKKESESKEDTPRGEGDETPTAAAQATVLHTHVGICLTSCIKC